MKRFSLLLLTAVIAGLFSGCKSIDSRLPAEDIEIFARHNNLISILKNPRIRPNSREKYEAAKEFIRQVDLHYTRETATVDKFFFHRDAKVDGLNTDSPVFTFMYQYQNKFVKIRFFTYKMFVTRVEIKENE